MGHQSLNEGIEYLVTHLWLSHKDSSGTGKDGEAVTRLMLPDQKSGG